MIENFVKSLKMLISVIPAQAGSQEIKAVRKTLDTGLRCDEFLRDH